MNWKYLMNGLNQKSRKSISKVNKIIAFSKMALTTMTKLEFYHKLANHHIMTDYIQGRYYLSI